jgi:dienelactone hydrolase
MRPTVTAATLSDPTVQIPLSVTNLDADLQMVCDARAVVVFAREGRGSRLSPPEQELAVRFQRAGFATLLPDLLTAEEQRFDQWSARLNFNIPLLADRLTTVTEWLARDWSTKSLPVAYFGTGTGAAAALAAAASGTHDVLAIVSAGGRPDLAWDLLPNVRVPTLLIVDCCDHVVEELNREALERLRCPSEMKIVPAASDPSEKAEELDYIATLAADWFTSHLPNN